jgi:hypothetical protein
VITAEQYRAEMGNLLRWRLETVLAYANTTRIPLRMPSGVPIYDMVFATDHPVGEKIMTSLYRQASAREPALIADAKARAAARRDKKKTDASGKVALFELGPEAFPVAPLAWQGEPCWDRTSRGWWV